jgi:hypothetical protein
MLTLAEHIEETKKITESRKKIGEKVYEHIANLYPDPSHFIFELLQNAEDAYKRHIDFKGEKHVIIELSEKDIRIFHNGLPFTEKDLKGISTFAYDENLKIGDVNQIGKFGIGFKSVFSITDFPHLYSNNVHGFKLRDFIVLEEQEPSSLLKDFTTMFYFPFKEENHQYYYDIVKSGLEKLNAFSLLFLEQITRIEVRFLSGQLPIIISRNKAENTHKFRVTINEVSHDFLIFSKPIIIKNQETSIKIAYFLKDNIITPFSALAKPAVFVHFITGETTDLEILIHGPFGTTPSREKIPLDTKSDRGAENIEILNHIASLFIETLFVLKENNYMDIDLWKILPLQEKPNDIVYELFYKKFFEIIKSDAELIPGIDNIHTSISKGALANNKKITNLIYAENLKQLFNKEQWITDEITESTEETTYIWKFLTSILGFQPIDIKALINNISPEFLSFRSDDWIKQFYSLLLDVKEGSNLFLQLKETMFIRTTKGTHIAPFVNNIPNAFLPVQDFPDQSKLIKDCFIQDKDSFEFLSNRLRLQTPDRVDFIINTIFPKYTNHQSKKISKRQNTDDLKHILAVMEDKTVSREKSELLKNSVKECPIIYAVNAKSKKVLFKCPGDVYVSSKVNLAFFKANPKIWFSAVNIGSEKLEKIGCASEIKIKSRPHTPGSNYIYFHSGWGWHVRGIDLFDPDAEMDGLDFALKHLTKERSSIIWKTLLRDDNYKRIEGVIQKCRYQGFLIDEIETEEKLSALGTQLTNTLWLYVNNKKRKPSVLFLKDLDKKNYDIDGSIPRLLSEKLGFKHDIIEKAESLGYKIVTKKEYNEFLKYKKEKEAEKEPPVEEPETPISSIPTEESNDGEEIKHPESTGTGDSGGGSASKKEPEDHSDGKSREKRFFDGLESDYISWGYELTEKKSNQISFKKDNDIIEIFWCNSKKLKQTGYDFKITKNDQLFKVIELKSTLADKGTPLSLSGPQWDTARDMYLSGEGDKYEVFCVYNAGKEKPDTVKILDPYYSHYKKLLKLVEVKFEPKIK